MAVFTVVTPAHAQFEGWHRSLGAAKAEARAKKTPLLILFVLEGCAECERMERSLKHPQVRQALAPFSKAVFEYHAQRDVAFRYGIEFTPTLLIYLPTDNFSSCYIQRVGALSPASLTRLAKRALAASKGSLDKAEASKPSTRLPQPETVPASSPTWQYINQRWTASSSSARTDVAAPTLTGCYRELTRLPEENSRRQTRGRR